MTKEMEEIQMERWRLASDRVREIAEEPEVEGKTGACFKKTAEFVLLMLEALEKAETGWLKTASLSSFRHGMTDFMEISRARLMNPAMPIRRMPYLSFRIHTARSCPFSMQSFGA